LIEPDDSDLSKENHLISLGRSFDLTDLYARTREKETKMKYRKKTISKE
jgi:hypothetical protein